MKSLLFEINTKRKTAISSGLEKFEEYKIEEYEKTYDEILVLAKE